MAVERPKTEIPALVSMRIHIVKIRFPIDSVRGAFPVRNNMNLMPMIRNDQMIRIGILPLYFIRDFWVSAKAGHRIAMTSETDIIKVQIIIF